MSKRNRKRQTRVEDHPDPVLSVTLYDRVSTSLVVLVIGLIFAVVLLALVYFLNKPAVLSLDVPLEMIELPGGKMDGAPDETLLVESPEDEVTDPSMNAEELEEIQVEETLENIVEVSERAVEQLPTQLDVAVTNSGTPGSSSGTGRSPLGFGPGKSGLPNENRWYIRFNDTGSLDTYAKQLDYFGIELGALLPEGKLIYLSNLAANPPKQRVSTSGKGENRLYMTWRGGQRRSSDFALFRQAGIELDNATVFHFYPKKTELLLLNIEKQYANRPVIEIRRTFFNVIPKGAGYEFFVIQQSYF